MELYWLAFILMLLITGQLLILQIQVKHQVVFRLQGLNCCLGVATHAAGNQCSYKQGFGGSCINDVTACRWSGLGVCMAAALSQWLWQDCCQEFKLSPGLICYLLMWPWVRIGLLVRTHFCGHQGGFFSPHMPSTAVAVFKCDSCHAHLMWLLWQILFIQHHCHHKSSIVLLELCVLLV